MSAKLIWSVTNEKKNLKKNGAKLVICIMYYSTVRTVTEMKEVLYTLITEITRA